MQARGPIARGGGAATYFDTEPQSADPIKRLIMNRKETGRFILWVSVPLALLVAVTAGAGLFWAPTYAQETPLWAMEGIGGDGVNLLLVVPVLLVSAIKAQRGSVAARLVWMGVLLYLLYSFVLYTFAVHFNPLFLVYCAVLGFSFYAVVGSVPELPVEEISQSYVSRTPVKTVALVFFLIAAVTAAGWLREIIPALLAGRVPQSARDAVLLTNPVHVLDLSLLLPGLVITAILLLRRKSVAFVLAPALIAFLILMSCELVGIGVVMVRKGFSSNFAMPAFFSALAVGLALLLWRYLRSENPPPRARV